MISLIQNVSFCFDPLAVFFILVIAISAVPSFVFSVGYLKAHFSRQRQKACTVLVALFVLSMCAVVSASNLLFFLFAWEVMSLVSYFLVVFEHEHESSIQAGTIYLVMTQIGTSFLLAAFLIMYARAGSFDFSAVKAAAVSFPAGLKNLLFIFLFVGFGVKAGVVPLHIWLPYAHPQAPSHVSSMMSGVMVKVAIYGMIRFIFVVLGIGQAWWGALVLALAGISCVVGVIYALMDNDIKKLLAYSTVENIGIILLGVGAGMILWHQGFEILACAAIAASMYHIINHSVFKGLLFLCAGSIYSATGTRDMEKLGALIKRMPQTAVCFLVAAMAISAIPPLSGFVSEWLTFQVLFAAARENILGQRLLFTLAITCLSLTSALAAACFVKAFGISFLGLPRSRHACEAKEVSFGMRFAMIFLSILTVGLGIFAGFVWKALLYVARDLFKIQPVAGVLPTGGISIDFPFSGVSLNVLLVTLVFAASMAVVYMLVYAGRRRVRLIGKTWDCGYYQLTPRTQYSDTAFSKPFRVAFSFFLLPYRKSEKIRETFYHVKQFTYETQTTSVFKRYLYQPLLRGIFNTAHRVKVFQMGSIHWYLGYIFVTLLLLMALSWYH